VSGNEPKKRVATKEEFAEALADVRLATAHAAYARALNTDKMLGRLHSRKALYFAKCGDAVKIGVSRDPEVRLDELQCGAPGKLVLLAVIPGAGTRERECHRRLTHLHIHGEWFRHTEEVDSLIAELS